eukprot:c5501_g2_i1 orf=3-209(+)
MDRGSHAMLVVSAQLSLHRESLQNKAPMNHRNQMRLESGWMKGSLSQTFSLFLSLPGLTLVRICVCVC